VFPFFITRQIQVWYSGSGGRWSRRFWIL